MTSFAELFTLSRRTTAADCIAVPSRVLLLAADDTRQELRLLLAERLPSWDVLEAESVARARFVLQLDPCDILILDAELLRDTDTLEWLESLQPLPIILLADDDADFLSAAVAHGATHWLPRTLALCHPGLLAAVLRRAARAGALWRRLREADAALSDCRRQVDRLVNRLWEAVPTASGTNWFTQRHMLERLQEEVERVKRHGGPLAVVLGELLPGVTSEEERADDLATWAAGQVGRSKRRSDVAGQYGPQGFMLVLPQTAEPAALGCCRRLRTLLEQPASPLRGPLRACFGVAAVNVEEGTSLTKLLRRAEERLEEAKMERSVV